MIVTEFQILDQNYIKQEQLKRIVGVLGFASISLFAIDTFKKLYSSLGRDILNHLSAKKIPVEALLKRKWKLIPFPNFVKNLFLFLWKNIMFLKTVKASISFIIIVLTGWFAYLIFSPPCNFDEDKILNYYSNSFNNSTMNNSTTFKLIFSFDHENDSVKKYGEDELDTMKRFLLAFKGCLVDTEEAVVIEIIGFVSEKKNNIKEIKQEVRLANDRAINTKIQLDSLKKNIMDSARIKDDFKYLDRVRIHVAEWKETREGYMNMIQARKFKEPKLENIKDSLSQRVYTSEYLNRRVEVWLVDAGSCD